MKKKNTYKKRNHKKNSSKRLVDNINITTIETMDLSNAKNLSVIYEQVPEKDVLKQDISGTEKILSEITKNKCHQLRILPLIIFGKSTNTELFVKYIVKVIVKHPEYLYYLRPTTYSKYGIVGEEPNLFAAVDSRLAFSLYCRMWDTNNEELSHPDSVISELREYLTRIGNTEDEADLIIKSCIDAD